MRAAHSWLPTGRHNEHRPLTEHQIDALILLLEDGRAVTHGGHWITGTRRCIHRDVITNLRRRMLCQATPKRGRSKTQYVYLSPVGEIVARAIKGRVQAKPDARPALVEPEAL